MGHNQMVGASAAGGVPAALLTNVRQIPAKVGWSSDMGSAGAGDVVGFTIMVTSKV